MLSHSARNKTEAATAFRLAIETARRQEDKLLELCAATNFAQSWGENKKRTEARDPLAPAYDRFTGGFDTADLKEEPT